MKYFLDTEFIEYPNTIDLISIGIVAEDGREYQAISSEYNYNDASEWVKENVILPLFWAQSPINKTYMDVHNFHKRIGKTNSQIADEIYTFICPPSLASEWAGVGSIDSGADAYLAANPPEFYGYYADYDWVLFCSLFGIMMDLPKGFPMYCRDLKQMVDAKANSIMVRAQLNSGFSRPFNEYLETLKLYSGYPKEVNKHLAIADARFNKALYEFLMAR